MEEDIHPTSPSGKSLKSKKSLPPKMGLIFPVSADKSIILVPKSSKIVSSPRQSKATTHINEEKGILYLNLSTITIKSLWLIISSFKH